MDEALAQLTQSYGVRVASSTLLEVLFSAEQVQTAMKTLEPRFQKLAELDRQRRELGLYFD
jgi:hypothetical protein